MPPSIVDVDGSLEGGGLQPRCRESPAEWIASYQCQLRPRAHESPDKYNVRAEGLSSIPVEMPRRSIKGGQVAGALDHPGG